MQMSATRSIAEIAVVLGRGLRVGKERKKKAPDHIEEVDQ